MKPGCEELDQHPANKLMVALFSYGSTKDILSINCFEALRFIEEIESGRFSDMAFNQSRRMEYRDLENHLIRYFHNFLAAVKTMVEHTRNMMHSELITELHRKEYQQEIKERFSDDLTKFVEDFRNYTLHFGLPKISHAFALMEEKWEILLDLHLLHDSNSWTSKSKRFIAEHPDKIRLSWLIATYQEKVMGMHEWLVISFTRHHQIQFDEFEELRATFTQTTSESDPQE